MTPEFASKWISEYGCNVYVHSADVTLFSTQLKRDLCTIRRSTAGDDGAAEENAGADRNARRGKRHRDQPMAAPII